MSLDLYQDETADKLSKLPPVSSPTPGAFDGFFRGAGLSTMRGLAEAGRAVDVLGSVGPIVQDAITGGTEAQDRYFREHDETFQSAVDYWTPKPNEVGVAGEVVGGLLSKLPLIIASPGFAVGETLLSRGEELVQKGVEPGKAVAAGAVEAGGLGLGIWMPILGGNLWQRVVVGGTGFNVAQGVATRGAQGAILEGTPAAEDFKAFDGQAMTLDVLLGAAFGSLAHLSREQRAQGALAWGRIKDWAERLSPSEKDALITLREAEHLNVDSAPGIPEGPRALNAHVERVRTAIEQLAKDEPVDVSTREVPRFKPNPERWTEAQRDAEMLMAEAHRTTSELVPEAVPGEPADIAPKGWTGVPSMESLLKMAGVDLNEPQPGEGPRTEGPQAPKPEAVTSSSSQPGAAEPARPSADPIAVEAERVAAAAPDFQLRVGTDDKGKPIVKSVRKFLDDARADVENAREDAGLFEIAARCLLGRA